MPVVRIRLALHGCLNRPFYHIVVATNKSKRDGKHIEQVGCYDPMPNYNREVVVGLNTDRIKYWLSVGAAPTVTVNKLLGLAGLIPKHPRLYLEAARERRAMAEKMWAKREDVNNGSHGDVEPSSHGAAETSSGSDLDGT